MKILLLFFLLLASQIIEAETNNYETSLSNVISLGYWEQNDKKGYLRFFTKTYGSEHIFSKLYVQWITLHDDGVSESKILSEVDIKELNSNFYSFTSPQCVGNWKCTSYKLNATHSFNNKKYIFTFTFPKIGMYTINENTL